MLRFYSLSFPAWERMWFLSYCGNVLIENRNGLLVDAELLQANDAVERDPALLMSERMEGSKRVTLAADRGHDTQTFVREMKT